MKNKNNKKGQAISLSPKSIKPIRFLIVTIKIFILPIIKKQKYLETSRLSNP